MVFLQLVTKLLPLPRFAIYHFQLLTTDLRNKKQLERKTSRRPRIYGPEKGVSLQADLLSLGQCKIEIFGRLFVVTRVSV